MKSKLQRWRVQILNTFFVALFIFIALSESAWEKDDPLVAVLLFFSGILLVVVASLGRLWCSLYIAGHKTEKLITEGPYSISRNPLYFFSLLGYVGIGLCTETFLITAVMLVAFFIYHPGIIKREEAKLKRVHGKAFEEYLASTPRFFPKVAKLREPEEYLVNPRIFRRHILHSLVFMWSVGILEVIEGLHDLGWLTHLVTIY